MTPRIAECPSADSDETATRYAAGRLPPDEMEVFEEHMLGCSRCQDAVLGSSAVASALRAPNERSLWQSWPLRLGAALAASLLIAVWVSRSREPGWGELARVDTVPAFDGVPVRTPGDAEVRSIDAGMAAYARGNYDEAARQLARAPASAAISFYLGIARLKTGDYAGATAALAAARDGNSPYASDAALYRAKAWLGMQGADSALSELSRVQPTAAVAAHAAALADSIKAVITR